MDFNNKKILLINYHGSLGGAERQALGISKILTEKYNCEVYLLLVFSAFTTDDFKNYAEECKIKKILYFGEQYFLLKREFSFRNFRRLVWSLKYLNRLRNGLSSFKFDIIIPFLNAPSKLAYYLYKILPTVKFTFWHQLGLDSYSRDLFEWYAARKISCLIANAPNGIDLFKQVYPIEDKKCFVLPQYVSLEYSKLNSNSIRKKYKVPEDAILIGMIAHYREEKYHDLLLKVFKELEAEYSNIYLLFLGNRKNTSATENKFLKLEDKINESNLGLKVVLLSEKDVKEVLSILDIGVLVSRIEGMPNAVMEYMLYKLPVVATNHAGCKQLLGNDNRFLIKNEESQLFIALKDLIHSESLRFEEGMRNSKMLGKFTKENYIEDLNRIMNVILKTK
ncbi:glycosyltransferase family 4 protein [Salegentibacter mishustinae]|uniref:glycosyltransferase family 4 protein n=1 Tax=Salegentibacter mishustinae TaxID=270918 RepID=UPI0024932D9C|nr:glycosyltransferase family 4 protein [Salegentibacter mishustinae]